MYFPPLYLSIPVHNTGLRRGPDEPDFQPTTNEIREISIELFYISTMNNTYPEYLPQYFTATIYQ